MNKEKFLVVLILLFLSFRLFSLQLSMPIQTYYSLVTGPFLWGNISYFLTFCFLFLLLVKSKWQIKAIGALVSISGIAILTDYILRGLFSHFSREFGMEFRFQLFCLLGLIFLKTGIDIFNKKYWVIDFLSSVSSLTIPILLIDWIYLTFLFYWEPSMHLRILIFQNLPLILISFFLILFKKFRKEEG